MAQPKSQIKQNAGNKQKIAILFLFFIISTASDWNLNLD